MIHQNLSTLRKLMLLKGATGGSKAIEATATGNPLTFLTDLAKPLKSLLIPFTPQQEGTGDPSPENIRPILPRNGLTVCHGVNLLPENSVSRTSNGIAIVRTNGHVKISGTVVNTEEYNAAVTGSFEADGSYCVVYGVPKAPDGATWYIFDGGNRITGQDINGIPFQTREGRNTMIGLSIGLGISINVEFDPVMFKTSETTETDISFPSPVYGGTLDVVSGVLTVTHGFHVDDGSVADNWSSIQYSDALIRFVLNKFKLANGAPKNNSTDKLKMNFLRSNSSPTLWNGFIGSTGNILCYLPTETIGSKAAWLEYLAEKPLQICYELATPQEITLTPEQITALVGNNTIWSDADGSMTAVYLKKG